MYDDDVTSPPRSLLNDERSPLSLLSPDELSLLPPRSPPRPLKDPRDIMNMISYMKIRWSWRDVKNDDVFHMTEMEMRFDSLQCCSRNIS